MISHHSMYTILPYHKRQAKRLGVEIASSTKGNYKLDVYQGGKYITSIGDKRFMDYALYHQQNPDLAEKRRHLYWKRHAKDNVPNTRGWFSLRLLWA